MSKRTFALHADNLRSVMLEVWQYVCELIADEPKGLEVSVKTISLRSAQANALLWVRLHELEQQTDWHGVRLTAEEFKDLLSAGLVKSKVVPNIEGTGFVILGQRTSQMSIRQMNELITLIESFGCERGVRFSADPRVVEEYDIR